MSDYTVQNMVKETSTSTGTGTITLAGAVTGFQSFGTAAGSSALVCYEIAALDGDGVRSGDWEIGLGRYWLDGSTPKLDRLMPMAKTVAGGAGTLVNFSSGTKHVSLTACAAQVAGLKLYVDHTVNIYVRADGNDNNGGFANTAGGALASVEAALALAARFAAGVTVIVHVGAGSFAVGSWATFSGECATEIVGAGVGSTTINGITASDGGRLEISNCLLGNYGIQCYGLGSYVNGSDLEFSGAGGWPHVSARDGGVVQLGDYSVSAISSGGDHIFLGDLSRVVLAGLVTVMDDLTIGAWIGADGPFAYCDAGCSFSLGAFSVTGPRYRATQGSIIQTGGSGASFLPGSTAGSVASGGQYL
jgi:hypothetical protein